MSTFEITIERKTEEGWPVVVERTSPGASLRLRAEGMLLLGPEAEQALLAAALEPKAYGTSSARRCSAIRSATPSPAPERKPPATTGCGCC